MSKKKKIGIIAGSCLTALLFLCVVAYFAVGNYFYNFALNPKSTIFSDQMAQGISSGGGTSGTENVFLDGDWFTNKASYKEIQIKSEDGLSLSGYEINNEQATHNWAITIHGYRSKARDMGYFAMNFAQKGYNVLMPNLRGHDKSEGDSIGMGYLDRLDILKWIDYIIQKDPDAKIMLHGVSMGGATVMMTTGENLPPNVKVAVEDCGYTSAYDQFTYVLTGDMMNLPEFPIMNAANQIVKLRSKYDLKDASAIEQLKKSKTPTLFIHGDKDSFVPYFMLDQVFDAAACKDKKKVVIPGAEHAQASSVDPTGYWNAIWEFTDQYMN